MVILKDRPHLPLILYAPIKDQVMMDPLMKKGGIAQKQKVKQTQVVNVRVNLAPAEKKAKQRRQPPRAKKGDMPAPRAKKAAGDMIHVRKGNAPGHPLGGWPTGHSTTRYEHRPSPPPSSYGEHRRLAGPGQSYANLPSPLYYPNYAAPPTVMVTPSAPAFMPYGTSYNHNRNQDDDIRVAVNPSDIRPVMQPSKTLVKSVARPAPPLQAPTPYGPTAFQGEVPRLNEIDLSPSERALPSDPTDGFLLANTPGFMSPREQQAELEADLEEVAKEYTSAAVNAFESAQPAVSASAAVRDPGSRMKRPTKVPVNVGGESSSGSLSMHTPLRRLSYDELMRDPSSIVGDKRTDELFNMLTAFGYKNSRQDERFRKQAGDNRGDVVRRMEDTIKKEQQAMIARGKQSSMRRGGSVF